MNYVSLQNIIHEKIKFSDYSKTQARAVRHASDEMNKKIKLLFHKTWNSVIAEYFLKFKAMD